MTALGKLAKVERNYGQLGPEERFRLWAMAESRGDDADARRLIDTCPKFTYTMNDTAFSERARGLTHMFFYVILVLNGAEKSRRWGADVVPALARELGSRANDLCDLAWRMGYNAGAAAAGRPDLEGQPGGLQTSLKRPLDMANIWPELIGAETGAMPGDFVAFVHAFNAWGLDVTGAGGLALLAGYSGGDPFALRLVELAGLALAIEPNAAELAEARAGLDDLWKRCAGQG